MKKLVNPTPVFAMAIAKSKLLQRMNAWSDVLVDHLSKCVMYGDTLPGDKYNHWIKDELATYISDTNDMVCKHNNCKLKPNQYETTLFGWLSDSPAEAKSNLHDLQRKNKQFTDPYPEVDVDDNMIRKMTEASKSILAVFVPMLASTNSTTKAEIEQKLHEILDLICLSE